MFAFGIAIAMTTPIIVGFVLTRMPAATPAASVAQPSLNTLEPTQVYSQLDKAVQVQSGQEYFKGAHFVGSKSCGECHAGQVKDWHKTWHAKMEQWATSETVLGEFDDQIITYKDVPALAPDGKTQNVTFQIKAHRQGADYAFTIFDQDQPANNQTYKVAKTLGGKWDQGYEVKIGDNYYAAPLRYSVKNKGWLVKQFFPQDWVIADGTPDGRPRRPDELIKSRTAEAKCQGCHTTGFEYSKNEKAGVWQSAAAPEGHAELGVACEQCHGPASRHVEAAKAAKIAGKPLDPANRHIVHMLKDLDHNQQTQVCASCHGRGTNKKHSELAFPLGFRPGDRDIADRHRFWTYSGSSNPAETKYVYPNDWAKRNRQQWQDYTKSRHFNKADMSCLSCHNFHGKTEDAQLRMPPQKLCTNCHTAGGEARQPNVEMYEGSAMQQAGVTCINCHMARIAFRTTETSKTSRLTGDGSSHVFMTATPHLKKAGGVRSACEACHTKGVDMLDDVESWILQHPMTNEELIKWMDEVKAGVRNRLEVVTKTLTGWKPTTAAARALVDRAQVNIGIVVRDGSFGVHNAKKTLAMLDEALAIAREAAMLSGQPLKPSATNQPATHPATPATETETMVQFQPSSTSAPTVADAKAVTPTVTVDNGVPRPDAWYIVKPNDTLSLIASKAYGHPEMYPLIFKSNRKVLADPNELRPATRVFIPRLPEKMPAAESQTRRPS